MLPAHSREKMEGERHSPRSGEGDGNSQLQDSHERSGRSFPPSIISHDQRQSEASSDVQGSYQLIVMAAGGQHDAISNCSTATSEQSDRVEQSGPFQCYVCQKEFSSVRARSGHMKKHSLFPRKKDKLAQSKQVAEHKSASGMLGQNDSSALSKLSQAHLQRSASEGSLTGSICMGAPPSIAASAHREVLQPNPYNPPRSLLPSLNWNSVNILRGTQDSVSTFRLYQRLAPSDQGRQGYCPMLNSNTSSVEQLPCDTSYVKAMHLAMDPSDSDMPTAHRSNSLQSEQTRADKESILAGPADLDTNLPSSNRGLVHQGASSSPSDISQQNVAAEESDDGSLMTKQQAKERANISDSDMPTAHRSSSLHSEQTRAEEESILAGPADADINLSLSNRGLVHQDASSLPSAQSQQNVAAKECDDGSLTKKRQAEKRANSSDSDMPTAHRSNSLQSEQTRAEEESILAGPADVDTNLSLSNRGLVHQGASSSPSAQSQQNVAAEECDDGSLTTKQQAKKRADSQ